MLANAARTLALVVLLFATSPSLFAQTNVAGWQSDGQTWIVWQDTVPTPASYCIFASSSDFLATGNISAGTEVGRMMEADWSAARLRVALPGGTWRVPLPGGGSYPLAVDEGVFAYTPHEARDLYFAVVKQGETVVTPGNSTGPISQVVGLPTAHHQGTRPTPGSGQTLHVFAHWLDGRSDHASGLPGYPVMGNAGSNGTGSVFLVTEPLGGLQEGEVPAIVALHGGGGHYMNFVGGGHPDIGLEFDDALLITSDGTTNTWGGPRGSAWLGYWEEFDRFAQPPATSVPDGSLVVDYLMRRLLWEIDWVVASFPVDTHRLSILGHSGGARGASQVARVHPERFAAVHLYTASMRTGEDDNPFFGSRSQNLATTLPGAPGVADLADEAFHASATERDLPFARIVIGRADATTSGWGEDKVLKYAQLDALRLGRHLFFDERGHGVQRWGGAYFNGSTMLEARSLLRHRVDESYPAFFGDDQDPYTPGRQPTMGNGDPADGDLHGTYGGYYDWDQATLVDLPQRWACTFWLRGASANPSDEFPGTVATVGIAVRRPQSFRPEPHGAVLWSLIRLSDRAILQAGRTSAGPEGLVAVDGLVVTRDPERVRLVFRALAPGPNRDTRKAPGAANESGFR